MNSVPHHFTVDVEEYFQVSAFDRHVPRSSWPGRERRLDQVMPLLLDMLAEASATGTFFVLGVVAVENPELVRRIAAAGHEVASHGWDHRRVTDLDPAGFRQQVRDSRSLLSDLAGLPVAGYRAPSFSIVPGLEWALEILVEEGYGYDSSLYPVRRPGYGYPGGPSTIHARATPAGPLMEVPPSTLRLAGMRLPAGGGGTFRQLPPVFTRAALRQSASEGEPGTFYIHPWELDPEQPRVSGLPWLTRVRHYRGLPQTEQRLIDLLRDFRFQSIGEGLAARRST
jgi:polysaccharide deacetylase family protein (PEP-CTERM system associated)